jgi:ribosomal protein S18 acetylase RimI-like enzyme
MKSISVNDEIFSIRPAKESDAESLADLGARTFADAYSSILPAEDLGAYLREAFSVERMIEDIANPEVLLFVASTSEVVCAYIKLQPTTAPEPVEATNPIELMRLYILSGQQGCGIGTALMDAAFSVARDREYTTCWLKVWEGNHKAIGFYKSKGFSQIGNQAYPVGNVCRNVILMVCPLGA